MRVKEISIVVKPSRVIEGYRTVDVKINVDGIEKCSNELLKDEDIKSRLDEMLDIAKYSLLEIIREYDD